MQLSQQQQQFFEEFGFLQFPGLLSDRIETIVADFEQLFVQHGGGHNGQAHDGKSRSCIAPFADRSVGLSGLVDEPRIAGIAASLLGENWNYMGSDGNYYVGDTAWHTDGWHPEGRYLKIAFYLDEVKHDTGALRVIPGSHRVLEGGKNGFPGVWNPLGNLGIEGRDVPSFALESKPGDVVAFNHNLFHSAWGGSNRRRMFTLNFCDHADTPAKIQEMENFVAGAARFWLDKPFGDVMMETANAERQRHLQQVIENSGHLPALCAKARETMSEPARG